MVFGGRRWRQRVFYSSGGKPTLYCLHHQQYFTHTWIALKRTFTINAIMGLLAPQSGALRISAYGDFHPIPSHPLIAFEHLSLSIVI